VAARECELAGGFGGARGLIGMNEAVEMARALAYDLAKRAYKV
jgi:translation initiation factor IF-3